ncbi:hypothetical protein [Streptomyces sp. NPDC002044]|uniref:hypothetical protein n=1 Tax=Streptomyces sp. NPDC002044 TaxID=3154662 RepID=UPI0033275BFA
MQETMFAARAAAGVPGPLRVSWTESDSPIYDRLEREWVRAGKTVPRPPGPVGRDRVERRERFERT